MAAGICRGNRVVTPTAAAPDDDRAVGAVGVVRLEGEQPDPRGQHRLGFHFGERRLDGESVGDPRDDPGQPDPRRQGHGDGNLMARDGGQVLPLVGDRSGFLPQTQQRRVPQSSGGQIAAELLRRCDVALGGAVQQPRQDPVSDPPLLQGVQGHRDLVVRSLRVRDRRQPQLLPQEVPRRVAEEVDQVGQGHVGDLWWGQGCLEHPGRGRWWPAQRQGTCQRILVVAERVCGHQRPRCEVAGIERLQRVPDDQFGHLAPGDDGESVEQLAHGYRRRLGAVRAQIAARVGDHQVIGGRHDGIQEQLAVLGGGIALAHSRQPGGDVISVRVGMAWEHAVVQPEQADHPVRHCPHGSQ